MSTPTLLRSTAHPPCPEEQEVLEITVPTDRKTLAFTERMSLRLGLWLLLRAQHPRRTPPPMTHEEMVRLFEARHTSEREAMAMLTFDMQRYLR
ncbi:hypothetical protein DC31_15130 [Microbacterium sp. CH12i]|uniref:hypothetical protein n=1 Tax=Microbacterium sp. CH12i TaxID=1479651 RepID=UPI000460D5C0|nr:hypothetical protein [Microbacterium sp. CH12i]KDA05737.1 hypothetical protein DC31_15130 [Microbacterium sp. CH12i]